MHTNVSVRALQTDAFSLKVDGAHTRTFGFGTGSMQTILRNGFAARTAMIADVSNRVVLNARGRISDALGAPACAPLRIRRERESLVGEDGSSPASVGTAHTC
jgi:hypothetical protein